MAVSYEASFSLARRGRGVEKLGGDRSRRRTSLGAVLVVGLLALSDSLFLGASAAHAEDSVESDYERARAALARRDWEQSAELLRRILKNTRGVPELVLELAKSLLYSGRREEALNALRDAATRERGQSRVDLLKKADLYSRIFLTNDAYQTYQNGLNLLVMRRHKDARERFEAARRLEPNHIEVLIRAGQGYLLEGDFVTAIERLEQARKLNPNEPEARLWLGRALHQRGRLTEALDELRAVTTVQRPLSELAALWFAEALVDAGEKTAAIQFLEKDVKGEPFHLQPLVMLAKLRYQAVGRDPAALMGVRKDLQIALSRAEQYASSEGVRLSRSDGPLTVDLRDPVALKTEIQSLFQRVEGRLSQGVEP